MGTRLSLCRRQWNVETPFNVRRSRPLSAVKAVVLHQNGFRRTNLDNPRNGMIRCHFQVWHTGDVDQMADLEAWLVSASNNANRISVAIEFSGNLEGSNGTRYKPEKFGSHTLTEHQIIAGRTLMRRLACILPLTHVFAHRQFGVNKAGRPNKPLCCGREIWTEIGEWSKKYLNLSDEVPDFAKGTAIPDDWREEPRRV